MPLPDERLVFIDLETGGGEPWRPIMQLAAIAVDSDVRELETLEMKLRFQRHRVHPGCLRKPGYSAERWAQEALSEREAGRRFSDFLKRHATVDLVSGNGRSYRVAQLVAHHASFDAPFLTAWFKRLDRFLPAHPRVLCTHQRALWLFHEDKSLCPPADYQLGTLCQFFGVRLKNHEAHEALADVRATVALYRAMMRLSSDRRRTTAAAPTGGDRVTLADRPLVETASRSGPSLVETASHLGTTNREKMLSNRAESFDDLLSPSAANGSPQRMNSNTAQKAKGIASERGRSPAHSSLASLVK